jgi:hypothetical protein
MMGERRSAPIPIPEKIMPVASPRLFWNHRGMRAPCIEKPLNDVPNAIRTPVRKYTCQREEMKKPPVNPRPTKTEPHGMTERGPYFSNREPMSGLVRA